MGSYASMYRDDGSLTVLEHSSPDSADWITLHATATGLAIVEVERLWMRFQQLGPNKNGLLTPGVFQRRPASDDIFIKNLLVTMRNDAGTISFQTFLNAMKWGETSTITDKVRAIYQFFNNGDVLTQDVMKKLARRVYPDMSEQESLELAELIMQEADTQNQGYLDEDQFVSWVMNLPQESIVPVLEFNIVPLEINKDAHRAFSSLSKGGQPTSFHPRDSDSYLNSESNFTRQIPSDVILQKIAEKVHKRDWQYLGNKLGFTANKLSAIEDKHNNSVDCVFDMLKIWRSREGSRAYAERLERALRESNLNDAAMLLYP